MNFIPLISASEQARESFGLMHSDTRGPTPDQGLENAYGRVLPDERKDFAKQKHPINRHSERTAESRTKCHGQFL